MACRRSRLARKGWTASWREPMAKARRRRRPQGTHCLTPRQLQILTCIRDARRNLGYSPTLQEIADELGISKITVF